MKYITRYEDIIFVEDDIVIPYESKGTVLCSLGDSRVKMKTIDAVKTSLCDQAKSIGANAIIMLEYGQKKKGSSDDGVVYYGKGIAVYCYDLEQLISKQR